jgi:cobalt/nickel transport system permease protein
MVCETFSQGDSVVHRIDPRLRIVTALGLSVVIAVSGRFATLGVGAGVAVLLAFAARLPVRPVLKRLAALNAFVLLLAILLPPAMPGRELFRVGSLVYTQEGLARAGAIALKANTIVLAFTALLSTLEVVTLGHALSHLRLPDKLVVLFFFTVRYLEELHHEVRRLRGAMKVRGFRPRMNMHTYRSYGQLVGMLLVRSFDRSERILAAMKCRGFRGEFYLLDHFHTHRRDAVFACVAVLALVALVWMEWLWPMMA